MTGTTEQDIRITCGECDAVVVGIDPMIAHVLSTHKQYRQDEAVIYANMWMEDAFAKDEEAEAESCRQAKIEYDIDESIERDIRFQRHGL